MALQQFTPQPSKTQIILSNGEWVDVPEDADPDFIRKVKEAAIARAANPQPKRKASRESGKPNKTTNYAARVIGRSTDPTIDPNIIIIHSAGGTTYVSRESNEVSYETL